GYVYEGWQVPLEYDPLLAKLVVWGGTRDEAVTRLRRALGEYIVGGIQTNIPFFRRLVERPEFLRGELDTELIDRMLSEKGTPLLPPAVETAAALAVAMQETRPSRNGVRSGGPVSQWKQAARPEGLWGSLRRKR
ncbi:MAG: acetyl-CoA carboxylase biotin carboxylase subunit, partial [Candidatus Acidiferrales bacterium]